MATPDEIFKARAVYGTPNCIIQFVNMNPNDVVGMVDEWRHVKKMIDFDLDYRVKQLKEKEFRTQTKDQRSGIS